MSYSFTTFPVLLAIGALVAGCSGGHSPQHSPFDGGYEGAVQGNAFGVTDVSAAGFVTDGPHGLMIRIDVTGLTEGFHGVHIHQTGDCSDAEAGFKASGSHFNPTGREHGLLNPAGFEAADLPNIYAHHSGHARAELFVSGTRLSDVLDTDGFALVVHEKPDDHITQPIGGAGPRLACIAFTP